MLEKAARTYTFNQNEMLKAIEISTSTGNELDIVELFRDYVINFFRSNDAIKLLPQPIEGALMSRYSSPEIAEKAFWNWNTRQKEDGAVGSCTIYLKSDKRIRSKTSTRLIRNGAVYIIESTTSS